MSWRRPSPGRPRGRSQGCVPLRAHVPYHSVSENARRVLTVFRMFPI